MIRSDVFQGEVRRTPFRCEASLPSFDLIVVGCGTAGSIAAVTAVEMGLSVLVLEKSSFPGGIGTGGLVNIYYMGIQHGRYLRIDEAVRRRESACRYVGLPNAFSAELRQCELDRLLDGADVRYGSVVSAVLLEEENPSRVRGVEWVQNETICAASASYVIDATAEAQVVFLAGGLTHFGRELDGLPQPFTLNYSRSFSGTRYMNGMDSGNINQCDSEIFSEEVFRAASEFLPEQINEMNRVDFFSELPAVREGRRIEGEETIRFADLISGHGTCEPVAWEYSNWDTHSPDIAFESKLARMWNAAFQWGTALHVPIPRGALIPRGMQGVLVAGRMLSADHDAAQLVRMRGSMQQIGEAAAVLAWFAIRDRCDVRDVPYSLLRAVLNPPDLSLADADLFLTDELSIRSELASPNPGRAIWSAYRLGRISYLLELLPSEESMVPAAFALALLGHRADRVPEILRAVVRDTSSFVAADTSLRFSESAIALIGSLADTESIPLLSEVLCSADCPSGERLHAFVSLREIGQISVAARDSVQLAFEVFSCDSDPRVPVLFFGNPNPIDYANRLRILMERTLREWGLVTRISPLLDAASLSALERAMRVRPL